VSQTAEDQSAVHETGTAAASGCPVWPFPRPSSMEMPHEYARMRAEEPIKQVSMLKGGTAWLVTRYDDVKFVLSDSRFSPRTPAGPMGSSEANRSSLFQDPPAHTRLRRLVSQAFTSRRVEDLRPAAAQIVGDLVDKMVASGAPADLMSNFAFRIPVDVMAEMIGVPPAEREEFRISATKLILLDETAIDELVTIGPKVAELIADLVRRKRVDPGDDLLSALIAVRDEDQDRLSEEELVTMGMTLLIAGFVATANSVGLGAILLMRDGLMPRLHDDPSLIDGAVEEVLRYEPKVSGPARMAKEDVEVAGVLVRAGEMVLAPEQCANRDEQVFPDAARFDIHRRDYHHLAFGHGIHHCLGAALARMQLQEAFRALSSRLPNLRPAMDTEELVWRMNFFGDSRFRELPVEW
jgi:cytochrome P450